MSGHSKWANIKHKKAKTDAQRGVSFAKFSREIIISAKMGGGDPASNFRLRTAIEKAKAGGLPNDTIKRAIERATGGGEGGNFEEITYEGYGAGGVAVFVEVATDNRNRSAGDIRSFFTKFGGNLGETGCVGWIFEPCGVIYFDKSVGYDNIFEAGIEFDIQDVEEEDDQLKVITTVENFQKTVEGYEKAGFKIQSSELTRVPSNSVEIKDVSTAKKIMNLLEKIEEHDDVQNVYSNFDIDDSIMEQL